jgi:hypothetical protein
MIALRPTVKRPFDESNNKWFSIDKRKHTARRR